MMTDALTVSPRFFAEDDTTALYRHYPNEIDLQSCHLELDLRDGDFNADWNGEIGNAVPSGVWHGIIRRWGIPCLTAAAANALMREIAPLAQRVLDGATVEWDGNNTVGRLDDAAAEAEQEILLALDDLDHLERIVEQDAGDWWGAGDLPQDLTAETTDDELAEIVKREESYVATCESGVHTVLVGAEELLTQKRETMREEVREELEEAAEQHAALEARRNELIRKLVSWGDSSRSVGERVGLTHTAVQKIAKR